MLATVAVLVALAAVPVRADTEDDLRRAKERVAKVQAELDAATAAYQQAFGQFVATQDRIVETRERMARTRQRLKRLRASLAARARQAYQQGAAGTLELLLSSNSFAEFADRAAFLDRMSQGESDLILRAQVTRESLTRQRDDLDALAAEQASTTKVLSQQQAAIDAKFGELLAIEDDLEQKLASERAAAAALTRIAPGTVIRGGALQACPVAGPRSYYDDFGAPRPGGRTHQGNDILAPRGTPVVAAHDGAVSMHPNDLGGNALYVTRSNGDYTYYAHLDSYVGGARTVSAGEQIGTVGNTGNASGGPTHLHFEYHPGGGAAVDPYPYLLAVCG